MTGKTPDYTRKAIDKYNQKFDRVTANIPKGYKKIIADNIGLSFGQYINMLILEDFSRRGLLDDPGRDPAE